MPQKATPVGLRLITREKRICEEAVIVMIASVFMRESDWSNYKAHIVRPLQYEHVVCSRRFTSNLLAVAIASDPDTLTLLNPRRIVGR